MFVESNPGLHFCALTILYSQAMELERTPLVPDGNGYRAIKEDKEMDPIAAGALIGGGLIMAGGAIGAGNDDSNRR